jgi:hypothetical protein
MREQEQPHVIKGTFGLVDQVLRLEQFRHDYPGVMVMSPIAAGGREWVASWDEENGSTTVTRMELREVLDILDKRFPPKGG